MIKYNSTMLYADIIIIDGRKVRLWVFYININNITVKSCLSVLLMEATGVLQENHRHNEQRECFIMFGKQINTSSLSGDTQRLYTVKVLIFAVHAILAVSPNWTNSRVPFFAYI